MSLKSLLLSSMSRRDLQEATDTGSVWEGFCGADLSLSDLHPKECLDSRYDLQKLRQGVD